MLNKKGTGFDDWVPALVNMVFIVIIVLFFVGYKISKEDIKFSLIDIAIRNMETDEFLLNYLQKNITLDINNDGIKDKIKMSDLIIFSFLKDEKDNYDILEEETKKILMELKKSDKSGWNIRMYLMPGDKKKVGIYTYRMYLSPAPIKPSGSTKSRAVSSVATTYLPLGKDDKYIKVKLEEVVEVKSW